jgi:hypothetical protein
MQVYCEHDNRHPDIHCNLCGQGFVVYWEGQSRPERSDALLEVEKALRDHHRLHPGAKAHPAHGFLVRERMHSTAGHGPSILGNAPSWAL